MEHPPPPSAQHLYAPPSPGEYCPFPASRKFTPPRRLLRRTLFIQTETAPNDNALKFLLGAPPLPPTCSPTTTIEYLSGYTSHSFPLALALDGITSVFFTPEYLTVTKETEPT
ncbi:hypothetical protein L211DRAFT_486144 [Terfezia boudieri ATCC MYA-4762]|uniref:Scaffold protein Nfu/NifU N-terminal domain-containing protein n=1 Tax=Terfezia boudieri ATCC MYA-4762 TaxID=1051890 RepID=A0A3N4M2K0_9PEZI|nr:hypothetical protein L211DRAFT_486144 [Terfezia boudieri ATCC MYA-4762]